MSKVGVCEAPRVPLVIGELLGVLQHVVVASPILRAVTCQHKRQVGVAVPHCCENGDVIGGASREACPFHQQHLRSRCVATAHYANQLVIVVQGANDLSKHWMWYLLVRLQRPDERRQPANCVGLRMSLHVEDAVRHSAAKDALERAGLTSAGRDLRTLFEGPDPRGKLVLQCDHNALVTVDLPGRVPRTSWLLVDGETHLRASWLLAHLRHSR